MIALIYFPEGDTSMLLNSSFLSSISDFAPEGRFAFATVKNNKRASVINVLNLFNEVMKDP